MEMTPDERLKFRHNCLHGSESLVFPGPENLQGRRFVTKIMKLKPRQSIRILYNAEQVARNILWMGQQKTNENLATIHHFRGIEADGEPALLIIQEYAEKEQNESGPAHFDPKIFKHFDDVQFSQKGSANTIKTKEGFKVVDLHINERLWEKQRCPPGKCDCNWHDFVEKTKSGFGGLPKNYILPQEIKKAYAMQANPWIKQIEKETQHPH